MDVLSRGDLLSRGVTRGAAIALGLGAAAPGAVAAAMAGGRAVGVSFPVALDDETVPDGSSAHLG